MGDSEALGVGVAVGVPDGVPDGDFFGAVASGSPHTYLPAGFFAHVSLFVGSFWPTVHGLPLTALTAVGLAVAVTFGVADVFGATVAFGVAVA